MFIPNHTVTFRSSPTIVSTRHGDAIRRWLLLPEPESVLPEQAVRAARVDSRCGRRREWQPLKAPDDLAIVLEALGPGIGVEALIETAAGLDNIREIAGASEPLEALIFGPLDMGASLGIGAFEVEGAEGYPGDIWHYARFRILVAARTVGVDAIDGPFPVVDDLVRLRMSAEIASAAGYDGKWVIHPSQIDPVNRVFSPSRATFDQASEILDALDRARRREIGAVEVGGVMVDEASRRMAEKIVARGRAAGLT
jgi:citrate lyase beta subunit